MKWKLILKSTISLFFFWFFTHIAFTIWDGLSKDEKFGDVGVVLGSKVNMDGTLSKRLQARLDCGRKLYEEGRIRKVIVSGGLGKEGFYEGSKMKEYLLTNGIPDTCVIVDNEGNTTSATIVNTLRLRDSLHFKSLIVISQYFHLSRTKKLFRKNGFSQVSGESPDYFEWRDVYSLFREFFAHYLQ